MSSVGRKKQAHTEFTEHTEPSTETYSHRTHGKDELRLLWIPWERKKQAPTEFTEHTEPSAEINSHRTHGKEEQKLL